MQWPHQSSDLNLIKRAFRLLKTKPLTKKPHKQAARENSSSKGLEMHGTGGNQACGDVHGV